MDSKITIPFVVELVEPNIIRPRHHKIYIIIPGDKALMPDSAEQGTSPQIIS